MLIKLIKSNKYIRRIADLINLIESFLTGVNLIREKLDEILFYQKLQANSMAISVGRRGAKLYNPHLLSARAYINEGEGKYFESELLEIVSASLSKNSIILDIGANIGNHSIYWAYERGVGKVLAFEPVSANYISLVKNIKENNVGKIVIPHNFALGSSNCSAGVYSYESANPGGTALREDKNGAISVKVLDSTLEQYPSIHAIDLVKIDVECMEMDVLIGAELTLRKFCPKIWIEIFDHDDLVFLRKYPVDYDKVEKMLKAGHRSEVFNLLDGYGYKLNSKLGLANYLFEKK